jgi:hypothetical protein
MLQIDAAYNVLSESQVQVVSSSIRSADTYLWRQKDMFARTMKCGKFKEWMTVFTERK